LASIPRPSWDSETAAVARLDLLHDLVAAVATCSRQQKWSPRMQATAAALAGELETLAGDLDKVASPVVAVDLAREAKKSLGARFAAFGDAVADDLLLQFRPRRRRRPQGRPGDLPRA
jgi:hypothetical protein